MEAGHFAALLGLPCLHGPVGRGVFGAGNRGMQNGTAIEGHFQQTVPYLPLILLARGRTAEIP